jgi:prepilin-type processing-associated H-X9-DG protein
LAGGAAFTLVELLVVIGIIALLISVLLPALNRARQSANSLTCQAKMRQIGQTIQIYANENRDSLPIGTFDGTWDHNPDSVRNANGTEYTVLLANLMNRKGGTWGEQTATGGGVRGIFADVDTVDYSTTAGATITGNATGYVHYSTNPRVMGNVEQWNCAAGTAATSGMPPYKKTQLRKSAETVILFDGAQIASLNGNASVEAYALDNFRLFSDHFFRLDYAQRVGINLGLPIDGGPNVDAKDFNNPAQAGGNIRWRHMGNKAANCLYADGHVATKKFKSKNENELTKRELCVPSIDHRG